MLNNPPLIVHQGNYFLMPGMATAHSHAFQRVLRGRTQRRPTTTSSFWSWRSLMYDLAGKLDPEDIFNISRFAFIELAMSGVTAIGEFHYLHHQTDGTPYDDRVMLADAVIRAAKSAGVRITLIRSGYFRGGYRQQLEPGQKRFSDHTIDDVFADVETLHRRYENDNMIKIGVAAHSIRAVPLAQLRELAQFAREKNLPFHIHLAEQRRELDECKHEYGKTPVALLAEHDVLDENFVAVHATHIAENEIKVLGAAKAFVCLCRTTERDLGDGLPPTAELIKAGAKICIGVDSHAGADTFEEIRAVELDERSRTEARTVAAEAPELLKIATQNGFAANGMSGKWNEDRVWLKADDPSVAGFDERLLPDAVIFGATPRAVERVAVGSKMIVENGVHENYGIALESYVKTLIKLALV